ncbi:hypothetical protein L2E82_49818 [Cichorium intybus]|uniref:Uncharacterized protein n=1 Tax=Cichorium intybus TaxID=13427 RepID=A0ACB8Z1C3_CICIN|nr:hypothetical protein L2E82_49818 [Cichorium intybus]
MDSKGSECFGVNKFLFCNRKEKGRKSKSEVYVRVDPSIMHSPQTIRVNDSSFNAFVKMSSSCSVMICDVQAAAATYSASVVDIDTHVCFFDCQLMSFPSRNWQPPEVFLRSIEHPLRSESE